jgi:hypothetical protein
MYPLEPGAFNAGFKSPRPTSAAPWHQFAACTVPGGRKLKLKSKLDSN